MKNFTLLLIIFFSFNLNAQFTKEEWKTIKKKSKGLIAVNDRHEERIWIESKHIKFEKGYFQIYFGLKKADGKVIKTPMRIKVHYQNANWIFFEEVIFAFTFQKDDDKFSKVSYNTNNPTRNSTTFVVEVSDDLLNYDVQEFLKFAAENKRWISIRLTGDQYVQYVIVGSSLKNNIPAILDAYKNEY